MGSGKSTVGLALADRLGVVFVDLDARIERIEGACIPSLFEDESEFRRKETLALRTLVTEPGWAGSGTIVATGGGVVLEESNWSLMEAHGQTVWLDVPLQILRERLTAPGNVDHRPLLVGSELEDRLTQLMNLREPLYRRARTVVSGADSVDAVCDRLQELVESTT